ncbi:N-acetyltransferase, partial [Lactobacillus crispatus]
HGFKIIKTVKEPWWSDPKSEPVSSDTMELV